MPSQFHDLFYFMEVDMENQKRQFYSAREIMEIRRAEWEKIRRAVFLGVIFTLLMESDRILNIIQSLCGR
jgi:hypothetical protein